MATSMSRRKNISKACEECRRRRAKCDGEKPSCTRCSSRMIDCQYATKSDGRSPAPKSYVKLLRDRIDLLEKILQMHSIDVEASVAQLVKDKKASTVDYNIGPLPSKYLAESTYDSCDDSELCEAFAGAFSLEETLNFDQDGEVRYFGPTSGRLELRAAGLNNSDNPDFQEGSSSQNLHGHGRSRLEFNHFFQKIATEDQPSAELKSHLLELYFTWEQPWCWIVNEKLFRESEAHNGRYHSLLLLNCILALGSRHSDRIDIRSDPEDSNTAGLIFLEKAEVLLHFDLKCPSITTIQSLFILGTVHLATGSDAAGWLHHGMANRLALDMGLNLDAATSGGLRLLSAEEVELRRQIYWILYCEDKLSASYTGRVYTLLDGQGAVALPSISNQEVDPSVVEASHTKFCHFKISACRILERIQSSLYAPKGRLHGPEKNAFLESTLLELRTWFYDLPSELRINRPSKPLDRPEVYILHMVYYTSIILLTKPFLPQNSTNDHQNIESLKIQEDKVAKKAGAQCYAAAQNICIVARTYRQVFTSFRNSPISATHCTLSAALVLQSAKNLSTIEGNKRHDNGLNRCIQVLEELSTSWSPAQKICRNLKKLRGPQKIPGHDTPYPLNLHQSASINPPAENLEPETYAVMVSTENIDNNNEFGYSGFPELDSTEVSADAEFDPFQDLMMEEFGTGLDLDDNFFAGDGFGSYDYTIEALPNDYREGDSLSRWQYSNAS